MNRQQRRKRGIMEPTRGAQDGLQVQMATKDGQVIVEFGVKLKWFGMDGDTCDEFIKNLKEQRKKLDAPTNPLEDLT